MVRYTRRIKYGGKKRKGTKKNKRSPRRSSPRRRSPPRPRRKGSYSSRSVTNENSWGLKKGSSKGCMRVCLGSTLR